MQRRQLLRRSRRRPHAERPDRRTARPGSRGSWRWGRRPRLVRTQPAAGPAARPRLPAAASCWGMGRRCRRCWTWRRRRTLPALVPRLPAQLLPHGRGAGRPLLLSTDLLLVWPAVQQRRGGAPRRSNRSSSARDRHRGGPHMVGSSQQGLQPCCGGSNAGRGAAYPSRGRATPGSRGVGGRRPALELKKVWAGQPWRCVLVGSVERQAADGKVRRPRRRRRRGGAGRSPPGGAHLNQRRLGALDGLVHGLSQSAGCAKWRSDRGLSGEGRRPKVDCLSPRLAS